MDKHGGWRDSQELRLKDRVHLLHEATLQDGRGDAFIYCTETNAARNVKKQESVPNENKRSDLRKRTSMKGK